jgi:hypothetical protein
MEKDLWRLEQSKAIDVFFRMSVKKHMKDYRFYIEKYMIIPVANDVNVTVIIVIILLP